MRYQDIDPTLRQYIGGHEALRKLGFKADEVFCQAARSAQHNGALHCFVLLRTQGIEFRMHAGPIRDGDEDKFFTEYKRVVAATVNGQVSQHTLDRIWQESGAYRNPMSLVVAINQAGIALPNPDLH